MEKIKADAQEKGDLGIVAEVNPDYFFHYYNDMKGIIL
jgi:hypothetical protein